jgi:hypothetical protein
MFTCLLIPWVIFTLLSSTCCAGILTNDQFDAARVPGTGRRPSPAAAGRRYCSRREADVIETAERGAGARLIAVLRIHDILGRIRIWIRGSMPLTNGSGSCYFRH